MSPDAKTEDRSACTPCRGSGKLISGKGGEPHEVECSWCGGTGKFQAGHNAQTTVAEPSVDEPTAVTDAAA